MLAEIGSADKVGDWVLKAKDPDDPFRLFGFGHGFTRTTTPARG